MKNYTYLKTKNIIFPLLLHQEEYSSNRVTIILSCISYTYTPLIIRYEPTSLSSERRSEV